MRLIHDVCVRSGPERGLLRPANRGIVAAGFRGLLSLGMVVGAAGLGGCSDPAREDGTLVEVDTAKQKEGFKKMEDYMQRKSKGEVPGIPKR
jgi:hypothetical protein